MTPDEMSDWCDRLVACGLAVRDRVRQVMSRSLSGLAEPVAVEGGDTIFELDRRVEPVIEEQIASWPAECLPLVLIAEGFGADGRRVFGELSEAARDSSDEAGKRHPGSNAPRGRFRILMDPIDGTRGLMYDKRPAWFLAAVAEDRGAETRLSDVFASVMVELPTTRHGYADHFFATRESKTQAVTLPLIPGDKKLPRQWTPKPSTAKTLEFGFGHVVNFFPGAKGVSGDLMDLIAQLTMPKGGTSPMQIFDDQYIATGGQMAELIRGHDRFCCDVRPLTDWIAQSHGFPPSTVCHPYDIAGKLVAEQAGVIICDPRGSGLDAPFDVTTPIAWCGYANRQLYRTISRIVDDWVFDLDQDELDDDDEDDGFDDDDENESIFA